MLETKPLVEITSEAIEILSKEIGVVDTVRFLNQFTSGYGDYTAERQKLFGEKSLEDIVMEINQKRHNDADIF